MARYMDIHQGVGIIDFGSKVRSVGVYASTYQSISERREREEEDPRGDTTGELPSRQLNERHWSYLMVHDLQSPTPDSSG